MKITGDYGQWKMRYLTQKEVDTLRSFDNDTEYKSDESGLTQEEVNDFLQGMIGNYTPENEYIVVEKSINAHIGTGYDTDKLLTPYVRSGFLRRI